MLYKIGIELNGIYFHSEISGGKDKYYHLNKTKYFNSLGVDIIHIFDSEWNEKKDIVKSLILSKLGLIKNKIFARKCVVKELNKEESAKFINDNHLQGYINSKIKLGMFFNAELVQVITLGKARFNKNFDYELIRFCTKKDIAVIGGFSKLLNYFKSNYGNSIITYADKRYSNGNVYLKNHFEFIRETNPNYFYTKDHVNLMNRLKFQKHKLEKQLENFNNDLSEWENMKQNGYDRIWDCGNLVFSLK